MYRSARLEALGRSVADRLHESQRTFFAELVSVNELGLALEMLADWLSEDERPLTGAERREFEVLAERTGNVARVLGPLSRCPE